MSAVPGEGFEPPKASPTDLQSAPFGRLGIPAGVPLPSGSIGENSDVGAAASGVDPVPNHATVFQPFRGVSLVRAGSSQVRLGIRIAIAGRWRVSQYVLGLRIPILPAQLPSFWLQHVRWAGGAESVGKWVGRRPGLVPRERCAHMAA